MQEHAIRADGGFSGCRARLPASLWEPPPGLLRAGGCSLLRHLGPLWDPAPEACRRLPCMLATPDGNCYFGGTKPQIRTLLPDPIIQALSSSSTKQGRP